jgi:hypothetical protein
MLPDRFVEARIKALSLGLKGLHAVASHGLSELVDDQKEPLDEGAGLFGVLKGPVEVVEGGEERLQDPGPFNAKGLLLFPLRSLAKVLKVGCEAKQPLLQVLGGLFRDDRLL